MRRAGKRDIAQEITDLIIAKIELGVLPWRRPWRTFGAGGRPLRAGGQAYTGINSILLWAIADGSGYQSRFWMTARQADELGGRIVKGALPAPSIYFNTLRKAGVPSLAGEDAGVRFIRFMRSYLVYNCDDIEGLPSRFYPDTLALKAPDPSAHQEAIDAFFSAIPIETRHGGSRAYYSPGGDYVQMPLKAAFISSDHHAATLAHEYAHATGAAHRLGREFGRRFGDKAYAFEEVVADMTSGMICCELGLPCELHDSHASYIDHWIGILKADKSAIITAAAKAEQAFKWLAAWSAPGRTSISEERHENAHAASLH
ncbi:ArdC family protein [Novosphingobium sp. JCM 18896]|uniref:ArdC family protein n=1 Tax=Novosphingobium sp. JCM 18896 TaxID=2989731 RepID=UPI0022214E78|nr:zincin-like metallopeptidase domain-containing protein [Novosphingobium sp. JCM 18896]MCW1431979.1 zincin-like metallopeptidase domain-containing protein [Novosphingobium sp. JCM 18896]